MRYNFLRILVRSVCTEFGINPNIEMEGMRKLQIQFLEKPLSCCPDGVTMTRMEPLEVVESYEKKFLAKALTLPLFTDACVWADEWAFNYQQCIDERLVSSLADEVRASKQVDMSSFFHDMMEGRVEVLGYNGDCTLWDPFEVFERPKPNAIAIDSGLFGPTCPEGVRRLLQ